MCRKSSLLISPGVTCSGWRKRLKTWASPLSNSFKEPAMPLPSRFSLSLD